MKDADQIELAGWIEWNGGECPVSADTLVTAQLRKDRTRAEIDAKASAGDTDRADQYDWSHSPAWPGSDIVAYRVASPTNTERAE